MTELSKEELIRIKDEAIEALRQAQGQATLESWRIKYLGRKGLLPTLLRGVKDLSAEVKGEIGKIGNEVRQELEEAYQEIFNDAGSQPKESKKTAKPQVQPSQELLGHLHPLTITMRRIQAIFSDMGFQYVETPLAEEPKNNFDFLNIHPEHPARAESDTFYLKNGNILRTHVSPAQIRGPKENSLKPPFKMIYYGRSYRAEKKDATHEDTFNQFEFMVVNKDVTLADLKGIARHVYSEFFGKELNIRFRPAYFPFVEPGLEVDIECVFCQQKGCRVCKDSGWLEMAGAGTVQPIVLKNINVDPEQYQGIAMGAAIDRLAMLRYGIGDIRMFHSGDLRFLRQFS